MRARVIAAAAAAMALGGAAPASAAYAPRMSFVVEPATPRAPAAITATVVQEPGESATRTQRVSFSSEFGFNPGFAVRGCTAAQEEARACPEESRIGTLTSVTGLGTFGGPVYFSEDFRLLIFVRGFAGLVEEKLVGIFVVRPDGGYDSIFDNLPNLAATFAELRMEGGPKTFSLTPKRCGRHLVIGHFTSHNGEEARSEASFEVSGCPTFVRDLRLSAASFRAVRRSSDRKRSGYGTTLIWRLSREASATQVRVERRERGRWRAVGAVTGPGRKGLNSLRFDGRLGGRALPPGRYRFALSAEGGRVERIGFRVRG